MQGICTFSSMSGTWKRIPWDCAQRIALNFLATLSAGVQLHDLPGFGVITIPPSRLDRSIRRNGP